LQLNSLPYQHSDMGRRRRQRAPYMSCQPPWNLPDTGGISLTSARLACPSEPPQARHEESDSRHCDRYPFQPGSSKGAAASRSQLLASGHGISLALESREDSGGAITLDSGKRFFYL